MAKGIAHRDWMISRDEFRTDEGVDEAAFRAAVQNELALAEHIGERLGVGIVSAPVRRRYPGGGFYTQAWVFKTATVPSAREAGAPASQRPEVKTEEIRPMVGPGGEEDDVPRSLWSSHLEAGWEFDDDDEDDDEDIEIPEALLERAE